MVEINQKDKETTINEIYVSLPLLILRYSIFAILAGVAGFLGFLTYSKLNATQLMDFQNFYTTAVSNVEGNLQESLQRQLVATSLMRNIFGTAIAGGYAGSLPNVTLPGFDVIMNDIGTLAGLGAITFSPLVTNSTRHQWEAYAISHASLLNSTDPEDTWKVTDGIGNISAVPYIYNSGLNSNSPEPSWLFPYWQVTSPYYENMIMLDPRSGSSNVRVAINHVITSKQSALSDVEKMFTLEDAQNARPSSILFSAINGFEAGNPIIGLFSAQFFWDEIIQVSQGEQLMDCVITTPTEVFTLRLDETGASLSGWSDLHDPCFDQYEISYNDNNLAFLAMFPGTGYTISFYPTKQFYKKYITSNPLNACLLAICLVIVPVLLQLVYMCLSKKFERKLENERNANVTQEVARGAVLKAKKVYVRYISHEMRTPLNAAHLGLKILEKDLSRGCGPENEDHLLIVREIGAACETAVTILNDLLNYDKLEDHMMIIERKTLAARSFLMDSIPVLAPQAKEKGVKILYDLDDRSVQSLYSGNVLPKGREEIDGMRHLSAEDYINVDENKMHQVIRNMVSNAIKFTPPGKSITIRARKRFNPAALVGITNILPQDTSKDLPSVFDFYSKSKSVKPPLVNRDLEMTVSTVSDSSEKDYGCLVLDVIDLGVGMKLEESSRLFKEVIQFNPGELQVCTLLIGWNGVLMRVISSIAKCLSACY